jgi:iron complex transport system permease protein
LFEYTLLGAGIMLICDIISQMPGFDITLPINAITSLFEHQSIWLLVRNENDGLGLGPFNNKM